MPPLSDPSSASPFLSGAPAMSALGYSPIPIKPGDKVPGLIQNGEWRPHKGWNRYCSERPKQFEIKLWSTWPDAGLGVACGNGLIAVDIDRDQLVDPVVAALPRTPVAKRGRKGLTLFYRGDTDRLRSRSFKIDGFTVLDFLAHGKQTVLPPSMHPATGNAYEWTTARTLGDTPLAQLAELTEDHVETLIEVLEAHGYERNAELPAWSGVIESNSRATDYFRRLNEDALQNLDAWVPALGLPKLVRQSGGYRAVPVWRPSNSGTPTMRRKLNLSLNKQGIVDFGDGEKTYTALNVVMAAHDLAEFQLDQAAIWLGDRLGYVDEPIMMIVDSGAERAKAAAQALAEAAEVEAQEAATKPTPEPARPLPAPARPVPAPSVAAPRPAPPPAALTTGPARIPTTKARRLDMLDELTREAPGALGDFVQWVTDSAPQPSRALAFGAALAALGVLSGRQYKGPTGLWNNVFTLGLAPSGFGKDHARDCVKHLFDQAGFDTYLGGSKIMSGSAIRKRLEQFRSSTLWLLDEFGGFVRELGDPRSGSHMRQIRDYLLELYSASKSEFRGADYAGELGSPIKHPIACIYGTSTPSDFWGAMTSRGIADGFLPRFLVFPVEPGEDELFDFVSPRMSSDKPPTGLIDICRQLTVPRGGNLAGRTPDGAVCPVRITWADQEAEAIWLDLRKRCIRRAHQDASDAASVWTRVAENALKIAQIAAVSTDPEAPAIYHHVMQWAADIAELSASMTLDEVEGRLADNDRQREHITVRRYILEAGPNGLTRTALGRLVNGLFDDRRLESILLSLKETTKEVDCVMREPKGGKGGRPSFRWTSRKFLTADEDE